MKKAQIKKLDRLFQQQVLKNRVSVLGGIAVVAHHFIGRSNLATRWYLPNGVGLSHNQHQSVHSDTQIKQILDTRLGKERIADLYQKSNIIADYLYYDFIVEHLMGEREYYIM